MSAKRIIVTGATSGIGRALVIELVKRGDDVIAIGRNPSKLNSLREDCAKLSGTLHLYRCDFKSLANVASLIRSLHEDYESGIDVLVNNAAIVPKKRTLSDDNLELQFQVNHLVPMMMSLKLKDLLEKRSGLIITTSSNAHKKAKFDKDDIEVSKKYHILRAYGRTKLYNVMFTLGFNQRFAADSIRAYAVHPGVVSTEIGTKDTSKLFAFLWKLYTKTGLKPHEATKTYIDLIDGQIPENKHPYYYKSRPHEHEDKGFKPEDIDVLWEYTEKRIKEKSAG